MGSLSALQTTLTVALTTAIVGAAAGPVGVAGYGTGSRLEYLLIPLVFGLGAPQVAMVGANIGAGARARAMQIAFAGAALSFAATESVGVAAAIWPRAWLSLFGDDPLMIATGAAYLRCVGPVYGFFGLGLSLYFASQGAGAAAVAAGGGVVASRHRGGGRGARAAAHRIADRRVRHARRGSGRLWRDGRLRRAVGRLVQGQLRTGVQPVGARTP